MILRYGSIVRKLAFQKMTIATIQKQDSVKVKVFGNYFFFYFRERFWQVPDWNAGVAGSDDTPADAPFFCREVYARLLSRKILGASHYILSNHFQMSCINDLDI